MQVPFHSSTPGFYRESMRLLDQAGVPFMVGGAVAFGVYTGIIRDTKDFDIMIHRSDIETALKAFQSAGYRAEIAFTHWLGKIHYGNAFVDLIYNSGNGICPVDEEWFANARTHEVLGRMAQICPPEEIIWQKAYIMERERFDGADIAHLLQASAATMDWERLTRRFADDGRVLLAHLLLFGFIYPDERSKIPQSVLDGLMARLESDSPEDGKICNGTFLSRAQYLVDIRARGFTDPRVITRAVLTPEECAAWTKGIAIDGPRV